MVSPKSRSDQAFFASLAELYGGELAGALLSPRALPMVPEITLYLLNDNYPTHSLDREPYEKLMAQPPYWAFCWGGGQAMARFVLDNPGSVSGMNVLDFGAGSAVAAIAALQAGAEGAIAVDIDPVALNAAKANAAINGVTLESCHQCRYQRDYLVLAADICYEDTGMEWVRQHLSSGGRILVADSRIEQLSSLLPDVRQVAEYSVKTLPDLEEHECFDNVRLYSNFL